MGFLGQPPNEMLFAELGGLGSVFDNDDQIDRLLEIVQSFGHQSTPLA